MLDLRYNWKSEAVETKALPENEVIEPKGREFPEG